jgi:uncharacterized protein YcbK (DUF882 family)
MIDRRQLLMTPVPLVLAAVATATSAAVIFPPLRWVKIVFSPTGERYNNFYYKNGEYDRTAVEQFSWTCRDYRAGDWMLLHPWLMDIVFLLHWRYMKDEISVFSGYRTPATNFQLEGAALNSQHMRGMALDIHIPDLDNNLVARDIGRFIYGGVGMYPGRGFVHFDFGPLRRWVG